MTKILLGGAAAAALVAIAPSALAQVAPAQPGAGKVQTRAEVAARVQAHFARLDSNRDGAITQAEVQALHAKRAERMAKRAERALRRDPGQRFARLDANQDGQVTRAEFDARIAARMQRGSAAGKAPANRASAGERLFARLDTNRDGAISRAEFDLRARAGAQRMERRAQRMAGRSGGRFGGRMFAMADANRDQRVTLEEATAAALQRFDRADLDRDGTVTREERRQLRQQRREQRQNRG